MQLALHQRHGCGLILQQQQLLLHRPAISRHSNGLLVLQQQLGQPLRPAWPVSACSSYSSKCRQQHVVKAAAAPTEVWPSLQKRSRSRLINQLNVEFGIEDFVEFYEASGGLPAVYLMHPQGHTLEIHLQGGTITRWLQADGTDLLFTRSDATFADGEPINSGIPVAFPQWRDGPLPYNGFADKLRWEVVGSDLDGEFINQLVSKQDFAEGRAELLIDEQGSALVRRPEGILDAEDDWEGLEAAQEGLAAGMDAMFDEEDQQQQRDAPAPKKRRGRVSAATLAAEAEAAEAAAAATAAADAAAAAAAAAAPAIPEAEAADSGSSSSEEEDSEGLSWHDEDLAEGEAEDESSVDFGIITDPAPYVILRLRDTEETRAIWPHKFELYYKITLMETDDFPDPKGDLPRGIFTWTGSNRPMRPEQEASMEAHNEGNDEAAAALAAAAAAAEAAELRDQARPGQRSYNEFRMFTDEDGTVIESDTDVITSGTGPRVTDAAAADDTEQHEEEPGSSGSSGRKKGKAQKVHAAGDEDGELPREFYDPPEQPMQIKMEWVLINRDPQGSDPMAFQLAALSHFRTKDQMRYGELVRILGLGGVVTFDYSQDPRKARLVGNDEDYITFEGDRRETVYIGSHDADVMFCPGSRTHFELLARKGLPDHVVWHPGALGLPGLEVEPRFFAQVGAGCLALPKKLAPGKKWRGEYVIRHHNKYWDPPIFDRDGPQPMPQLYPRRDDADDDDGLDDEEHVEGITSSQLGGGPDVPYNHE